MAKPKEFLIFESGKYPQGDYSNIEILGKFVEKFNSNKQRLSCFVGHKYSWEMRTDADEFSHGEINELRINQKGQVFAVDYSLDDYLKEAVATGKLLCCSPEIYGDPTKEIDIRGLAFLGRTPSQNPYAVLPQMFGVKNEFSDCIGSFSINTLKRYFKQSVNTTDINNEGVDIPMTDEEKKQFQVLQDRLTALESSNIELKTQNENFSKVITGNATADLQKESKDFFSKLQAEGKVAPAFFEKAVDLDSTLQGDEKKKFREMFSTMEPIIKPETHTLTGQLSDSSDNFSVDEIKRFQAENKISSFEEAAKLFQRKVGGK